MGIIEQAIVVAKEEGIEEGIKQGIKKGIEQGKIQGIEQGKIQGIEQGKIQGIEQGKVQGIEKGIEQEKKGVILNAQQVGLAIDLIARLVDLSEEKVLEILKDAHRI